MRWTIGFIYWILTTSKFDGSLHLYQAFPVDVYLGFFSYFLFSNSGIWECLVHSLGMQTEVCISQESPKKQ